MNNVRLDGYLGLAQRGRYLSFGETALDRCLKGQVKLLIIAEDAASNSLKEALNAAARMNVPHRLYATKAELGTLLGKNNIAVIGVAEAHLARQMMKELEDH
jgi:ribosomal protein L7Ae-like RNA K-turn-binding protein